MKTNIHQLDSTKISKLENEVGLLKMCAVVITSMFGILAFPAFGHPDQKTKFGEIDLERISSCKM